MKHILHKRKQVLLFIMAGGLSAAFEVVAMKGLTHILPTLFKFEKNFFGLAYPLSNLVSTTMAILLNYGLSIWFVFEQGRHSKKREFTYFLGISLFTMLLSLGIFQLLYHFVFCNPIDFFFYTFSPIVLSKGMSILLVSLLNYRIKKRIIFNS